ncbi:MAG: FAD binding domain-containing protein [Gammaproteobacteria bacterium]|nr:FAD binding domain-containing protein [Gammaproteobacteria bacterium]
MRSLKETLIKFYVNNKLVEKNVTPDETALNFFRNELGLTGAKEVCAEGDCGACTICFGKWCGEKFYYQAINSCLFPAVKLHGSHVITVEGLADGNKLHIIQQLMLENHAIQCGYCTPGIVMAMFCLFVNNSAPNKEDIAAALEGNLCRCTGYRAVLSAALNVSKFLAEAKAKAASFLPVYALEIQTKLKNIDAITHHERPAKIQEILCDYCLPNTLNEAFALMAEKQNNFKIINGGTDLMVQANLQQNYPQAFIDVSRIKEMQEISASAGKIIVGGAVTLSQLAKNELIAKKIPAIVSTLRVMASKQIRNLATVAGNIVNASPVADIACMLLALNAELVICAKDGSRKVKLENFYRDYKVTDLNQAHEIIQAIEIPLPYAFCSFEKSSKRVALDISSVNSAVNIDIKDDVVTACRIAFGGVAKFPALAKKGSEFLCGKKIDTSVIAELQKIIASEFSPISDVRGSAAYRATLIKNHLVKHFNRM